MRKIILFVFIGLISALAYEWLVYGLHVSSRIIWCAVLAQIVFSRLMGWIGFSSRQAVLMFLLFIIASRFTIVDPVGPTNDIIIACIIGIWILWDGMTWFWQRRSRRKRGQEEI